MADVGPWVAGLQVAAGVVYAALSILLGRRGAAGPQRQALNRFRVWWAGAAVVVVIAPLQWALHRWDILGSGSFQALQLVRLLAVSVAAWGLLSYLVYMYRGTRTWWPWLSGAYVLHALFLAWFAVSIDRGPVFERHGRIVAEGAGAAPLLALAVVVSVFVPLIVGVLAYLRLYRVATDATSRYRVALIGTSLLVWLSTALVLRSVMAARPGVEVALAVLALVAPLLVLAAYFPPADLQRRWGVRPLEPRRAEVGQTAPNP